MMHASGTAVDVKPALEESMTPVSSGDSVHSPSTDGYDDTSTDRCSSSRDEAEEVRRGTRKENINVQLWRLVVTVSLLATAVAVTLVTYRALDDEQDQNFATAYDQFSRTVESAVIDQQKTIRRTVRQFAIQYSAYAKSTNATFPTVTYPYFVPSVLPILHEARTEFLGVSHVIKPEQMDLWLDYAQANHAEVITNDRIQQQGSSEGLIPTGYTNYIKKINVAYFIFGDSHPLFVPDDDDKPLYLAVWQQCRAMLTYGYVNFNYFGGNRYDGFLEDTLALRNQTLFFATSAYGLPPGVTFTAEEHESRHAEYSAVDHPHSIFMHPVHEDPLDPNSDIVSIIFSGGAWDSVLYNLLPSDVKGLYAILGNSCNQTFTYEIVGRRTIYVGEGDFHDTRYDNYERFIDMALNDHADFDKYNNSCKYWMKLYPSDRFRDQYDTFTPEKYAIVIMCTFLAVIIVFFVYNMFVRRRNEKMVESAVQSNAIVSSVFPSQIRKRLIGSETHRGNGLGGLGIGNLNTFLAGTPNSQKVPKQALADLFLNTTILFADIAGFTAWSSVREPSHVFTFLEIVFSSFDQLAKARRVFKVETVGDCYVAATGIPNPRKDHAVVMCRFARDVLSRMHTLVKELEITHGPDTGDLSLRCGMHSGPVTAGVLRGERARFQLFGDTINTASRIEHTGEVGRIHVSADTAECLMNCGKGHWLTKRSDPINAKGKGQLQTYWVSNHGENADTKSTTSSEGIGNQGVQLPVTHQGLGTNADRLAQRVNRLVDWNVEMLSQILRQILARREALEALDGRNVTRNALRAHRNATPVSRTSVSAADSIFVPLDEVKEIIHLPGFDKRTVHCQRHPDEFEIKPEITEQLRSFIGNVASLYRDNAFHNFEHASHVTMSVIKLLSRIIAPDDIGPTAVDAHGGNGDDEERLAASIHDHTYGITSDPLTQFACAFSALIHDADHSGVPNAQLVKERARIAEIYNNRSVAEQNSLVLAWDLFMSDEYAELRSVVCADGTELRRFRELVVNAVMATDIVDKELKALRNARWERAFQGHQESSYDAVNRKATIVIEHLIQASDVAHTMQHWHVYRKWNERFFRECYQAYKDGRAESNPADGWYKGEIGFFDFYIIPLAKKLKDCGVFGKSSDEYLNYAQTNRAEWERRGEEVVAEMVARYDGKSGSQLSAEQAVSDNRTKHTE